MSARKTLPELAEILDAELKRRRAKKSRSKGAAGERELIAFAEPWFPGLKRNLAQSRGGGRGEGGDVGGAGAYHIEVKRHRRCNLGAALRQAIADARPESTPVAFCRDDRGEWIGVIRGADLLELMAEVANVLRKDAEAKNASVHDSARAEGAVEDCPPNGRTPEVPR